MQISTAKKFVREYEKCMFWPFLRFYGLSGKGAFTREAKSRNDVAAFSRDFHSLS